MKAKFFPHDLHLHILQLEHYQLRRSWSWLLKNYFKRKNLSAEKLVWTKKATLLWWVNIFTSAAILAVAYRWLPWGWGLLSIIIILCTPMIGYSLAILAMRPYESYVRRRAILTTKEKIINSGVPVIAITGSYAKTSVKKILVTLLKSQFDVLATPKSYNTIFGISAVVKYELDTNYDYFVAEIGAFNPGDIAELADMTHPTYGVLTGITTQHLERFKTLGAIIATKFELPEFIEHTTTATACYINGLDANIKTGLQARRLTKAVVWPQANNDDFTFTVNGFDPESHTTAVTMKAKGQTYELTTNLVGQAHMNNLSLAAFVAYNLGVSAKQLAQTITNMPQVPARFELTKHVDGYTVINNGYSSNVASFHSSLATLNSLPYTHKILVTPGIVELGADSYATHKQLSQAIDESQITHAIMVKPSARTQALQSKLTHKISLQVTTINDVWPAIAKLELPPEKTVVLFENDLPENY